MAKKGNMPSDGNGKPKFSDMSGLDKRLFSLGMYLVALVLAIWNPDVTNVAMHRLLGERLGKK